MTKHRPKLFSASPGRSARAGQRLEHGQQDQNATVCAA